jgi:vibriolysin
MIKKKWGIITLIFVLCCLMVTSSWAAKKVKFYKANAKDYIRMLNDNRGQGIGYAFGLDRDEDFKLIRQGKDFNGLTHQRYQQTFHGIPVWGMHTIVSKAGDKAVRLHGDMVLETKKDIAGIPASLDPLGALRQMQEQHKKIDKKAQWTFRNEKYGTYIYIDEKNKAHLCYVVSFFADTEQGNPSQPIYFVSVKNGKVLHSFDMLRYADGVGPGGNLKIGYYYYGTDYGPFGVTQNGSTCTMNTTDVKTVNLNHGTSGTTAYSYTCFENTHKEINGAYCPLNDAQYFGQVVYDMYMDWYGLAVLPFQLTMRVHYSTNYENAFWDGSSMTFGDGYTTFHPLVCLDVSSHEVSHGFTDYNSDLIYSGQSGGINESFSDMAGEAAEYYMRGSNDFMCGYDIFKAAGQALRYLYDPPLDGQSIDHVDDYYSGMDVHYSCGVFNKAFYLIATSPGWTTRMAFDVFVKCNTDYWQPSTNFQQGAEAAIDATIDYGYNCSHVVNAFAQVGITVTCPGPPVADFSGTPTSGPQPLTVNFTDLSSAATSWSWTFGDGGTSTQQNPSHTYTTAGTYTVSLTAANASGSDTETKVDYITVLPPQPPVADFTASSTSISVGDSVTFTDQSQNVPTSWSWTFEGGTPSTSTAQNPTVTYNSEGTFDVTLVATNAQGSDTETKVGYIDVTLQPYCTSQGNDQSYEYIAGVAVGDLNNPSGSSPYSDFTSLTANLTQGDSVSVSLTPGFVSSSYTEYWKIWIDYNGDHDFEDTGEEVFAGSGSSVVTGGFTVPGTAPLGYTRMRVSMSYSTYPPICGSFTYGEVEDYTANISGACTQYTLTTNSVGNGSITLDPAGGTYCEGTVVTLTAAPDAGWQFDNWSGDLSGTANPTTITMDSNKSVTANFSQLPVPDYTLTVTTVGQGSVTLDPPGGTYPEGTVVTLTATPDSGWQFDNWSGDLTGTANPATITMDADKNVTANFSEIGTCTETVGNTTVFGSTSTSTYRRAMPFTMPENGNICSVTMYHAGGSGGLILGVYDGMGAPQNRLGVTPTTTINSSAGWQTINLTSPAYVAGGSTVWLAWVYQSNPGIRYQTGSPGRFQSSQGWSGGMPDPFGSGSQTSYIYSIYATYAPAGGPSYGTVGNTTIFGSTSVSANRRAMPFTMPEDGTIESVTMYHAGGSGGLILGVYDGASTPQNRLGVTDSTTINTGAGWQTIPLQSPAFVAGGSTVWLAWVYQSNPGIAYQTGSPGRYQSGDTWSGGMPDPFGSGTQASYLYSIYATYSK